MFLQENKIHLNYLHNQMHAHFQKSLSVIEPQRNRNFIHSILCNQIVQVNGRFKSYLLLLLEILVPSDLLLPVVMMCTVYTKVLYSHVASKPYQFSVYLLKWN